VSNLIKNERIKLTAAWLNTLSGAATAAGAIAPLAATFYGVAAAPVSCGIPRGGKARRRKIVRGDAAVKRGCAAG
jgi:hypothetical protein